MLMRSWLACSSGPRSRAGPTTTRTPSGFVTEYPETRRGEVVELLHGRPIADPYRWLEDPDSAETVAWVAQQNVITDAYLACLPDRTWFLETMQAIVGRPRAGVPFRRAGWYVVSRNDGDQDQDVLYI